MQRVYEDTRKGTGFMNDGYSVVVSTCGDMESARRIARELVDLRIAACVQIFPIESVYAWQGEVCEESEVALFIKSKAELFDRVSQAIRERHPYEIPEIIQLQITDGLPDYLQWIESWVRE